MPVQVGGSVAIHISGSKFCAVYTFMFMDTHTHTFTHTCPLIFVYVIRILFLIKLLHYS